jgi:tetratricopeptide (TPR) repeat protein
VHEESQKTVISFMRGRLNSPTSIVRNRRVLTWSVVGIVLVGIGLGISWRDVGLAAALTETEQSLARHDLVAARAQLDRYFARWPRDQQALFLAAKVARRSDACADAERFLIAWEQRFGPTDASRLEWALLGAQQGDLALEEKRLETALSRDDPDALEIAEALAKGYNLSLRRREALTTLNRLLERDADYVPALVLRGTILDRLHRSDAAARDLRRAVELVSKSSAAHSALAAVLNRLGHTSEAIYHYQLAQHFGAPRRTTLLGLARAFSHAAQLAEAERRLDELVTAEPDFADGFMERARVALRRGRAAEAEGFLARALEAAPWHRDGHQLYLVALKELGRTAAASRCEARLAELSVEDAISARLKLRAINTPGAVGPRWDLWQWSVRNHESEESLAWLIEVLRVDPRHAQAHAAFADHFERADQPQRAALHRAAAAAR